MKTHILSFLVVLLIFSSCMGKKDIIKVGVFDKNGDSPWCIIDAVEACKIDPQIKVNVVSAAEIMSGDIDNYDVFLFPGGGGTSETNSLGNKGLQKIKNMVLKHGKGIVGICAGAYILSETPNYTCFELSGGEAIDIEHDHRGNGLAKFTLTNEGKNIFPELVNQDTLFCQYYEGPVLIPAIKSNYKYISLATMESDVHLIEGTPSNVTNNKPFVIMTECGKGRVASFVGHPECTPGMRFMIPRMVRWTIRKDLISYNSKVVRPQIYSKEILYNQYQKDLMNKYYKDLKGSPKEIIKAIDELIKMSPWSAKKWMPGLLRNNNPDVRKAAGMAVERLERTDAISDLESAILIENDLQIKVYLEHNLINLKAMINQ